VKAVFHQTKQDLEESSRRKEQTDRKPRSSQMLFSTTSMRLESTKTLLSQSPLQTKHLDVDIQFGTSQKKISK
jgi:hypothetical protein